MTRPNEISCKHFTFPYLELSIFVLPMRASNRQDQQDQLLQGLIFLKLVLCSYSTEIASELPIKHKIDL